MEIPILQILVSLIFVLLGFEIAGKPPQTLKARWLYSFFFIALGGLLLVLARVQYRNVERQEAEVVASAETLQFLESQIPKNEPPKLELQPQPVIVAPTNLQVAFARQTKVLESNQTDLEQKYQGLLNDLSTNASLDPNLKERVIIAKARLEAANAQLAELKRWEAGLKGGLKEASVLKQAQLQGASVEAQAIKDKVLPYFDEAVKSLQELSEKAAKLRGDESSSTYAGLPEEVSPEAMAGKRFRMNAAEIKFQNNDRWNFKVEFVEELTPDYEAQMNITCKGGILFLRSSGFLVEARVEIFNGQTFSHDATVGGAARKNIDDCLQKLVASELNAVEGVAAGR